MGAVVARLEEHLHEVMAGSSPRAYRNAFFGVIAAATASSVLLFLTGVSHQRVYPQDQGFLLDGGYRMICGQRPHADFHSHEGIVAYLPIVLGIMVGGVRAAALAYGPAILSPVLAVWTWWLSARRFSACVAMFFSWMTAGLVVGTFALSVEAWNIPTYAMQYNRLGWSLTCMLAATILVRPRHPMSQRLQVWEGVSAGLLAGLLLFLKPNYAGAAVVIPVTGLLLSRHGKAFWMGFAGALLVFFAAYAIYLRGDVFAYGRDMLRRLHCRAGQSGGRLSVTAIHSMPELWAPIALLILCLRPAAANCSQSKASWLRPALLALFCIPLGIVITAGNAQTRSIPLFALAAAALLEAFERVFVPSLPDAANVAASDGESRRLRSLIGYVVVLAAISGIAAPDYLSVANSFLRKVAGSRSVADDWRIDSPTMRDMAFSLREDDVKDSAQTLAKLRLRMVGSERTPHDYAFVVNDALQLLHGRVDKRSRVFSTYLSNPYPFALGLPSPRGAPAALFWGGDMNEEHYLPPEEIFGDVTHLLFCNLATTENKSMRRVFGDYIQDNFVLAAESELWTLYLRKGKPREIREELGTQR